MCEASDKLLLDEVKGRGCRIHISGGEPFGDWPRLIKICREAQKENLPPPEKIETNAFWAKDENIVRRRIGELAEAGMGKLVISTDPYHQQYVPIERCRLAAQVGEELLGPENIQVRWRDWLENGFDTGGMPESRRNQIFTRYARQGRDRLNGRAAEKIAPLVEQKKKPHEFADTNCKEALLRAKHVHVGPDGWVMPGTCAGIVLGKLPAEGDAHYKTNEVARLWNCLWKDHPSRPLLSTLAENGPYALSKTAMQVGFRPRDNYASKCHLCWEARKWLYMRGMHRKELGPEEIYCTVNTLQIKF